MSPLKVFFGEWPLVISHSQPVTITHNTHRVGKAGEALEAMLKTEHTEVLLVTSDPHFAMKEIFKNYRLVKAGGGLVVNTQNELLLIFRRSHWDLPKGHLEKGETIEACALREVTEETGIHDLEITGKEDISYHVYNDWGEDVLKETHWFRMRHTAPTELVLQTEEEIQNAAWVNIKDLSGYTPRMYASLRDMVNHFIDSHS